MKVLIVGGVAGGATAAARVRRLDETVEILVFERGPYISFANCGLPYYVGEVITERSDLLLATPAMFKQRYNIDVRTQTEVISIDSRLRLATVKHLPSGEVSAEGYDRLILSPGAAPLKIPGLEGDFPNLFQLRTLPDADRIKAYCDQYAPKSAIVVGGGFIGLEMAENLARRGIQATILEMFPQVLAPLDIEMAALVQQHLRQQGVVCRLADSAQAIESQAGQLWITTKQGQKLTSDLVILSIGVVPETDIARAAGLALNSRGAIKVNAAMMTSIPDIYAVGDAVEVADFLFGHPIQAPLAGPANRQARIAADNAVGRKSVYRGILGTAIVKVFELTAAVVGMNEKMLKAAGIPYRVSITHSGSHAFYYPGAEMMAVKLVFSPADGRLLGGQVVGKKGVDKRIDIIATAIRGRMTVYDLEDLELAYAPSFGSAKDAINIAGFVASNLLKGDVETINWDELPGLDLAETIFLDVREQIERDELGTIAGALHIPLNHLRKNLPNLDRHKQYVIFCAVGLRAYIGYRILVQHGFNVRNLSGGYMIYQAMKDING